MSTVPALPFAAWPKGRKIAAVVFAVSGCVMLACAAAYLAGMLFLGLNKVDPRRATLTSIADYWELYADDVLQRKKLQIATGASCLLMLVVVPAGLLAAARQQRPLHGAARFATPAEVARTGLTRAEDKPGILLGRYRGSYLWLPGELSVLLSAPTRSGKGVGVVIPNLLNWPDSLVVLDIKGENYDITAGFRAKHGQAVYAFSPFDAQARSHRWNPLSSIRSSEQHRVADLLSIGQVLYPTDSGGTQSEIFFNDQARNMFLGLGLLLLETPTLPRTIGEMLRLSSGRGQPVKDYLVALMARRQRSKRPLSNECIETLQRLLSNSENTLASVLATFTSPLTAFANPQVDVATSADDFRLEDVRRKRMSVYVRIPQHQVDSARPLITLFFSQLVNLNTQTLPQQDASLKVKCLLINDEFPVMGRVRAITNAAAFLSGYNLRLLTVVQAMAQLDALYGDREARAFSTNHGVQILFAPREQRDAEEYSAMLGYFTERSTSHGRSHSYGRTASNSVSRNESDQRRALLLPQEFKELGSERLVVLMENCKPILGEKIRYHRDKILKKRLLPAPEVPPMNLDLHLARAQQRWRFAEEFLPPGGNMTVEQLAGNLEQLPPVKDGEPREVANEAITGLTDLLEYSPAPGGSIEAIADEDGVMVDEPGAIKRLPN